MELLSGESLVDSIVALPSMVIRIAKGCFLALPFALALAGRPRIITNGVRSSSYTIINYDIKEVTDSLINRRNMRHNSNIRPDMIAITVVTLATVT
ncbi:hypothetical protein ACH5RR_033928 [Cinchona calisaya]|uniref:Uncharacterized protein n=1 Tax=Cinchona calisaya TaxID=153742 RepID=A0ABD2Y9E3_9GENT